MFSCNNPNNNKSTLGSVDEFGKTIYKYISEGNYDKLEELTLPNNSGQKTKISLKQFENSAPEYLEKNEISWSECKLQFIDYELYTFNNEIYARIMIEFSNENSSSNHGTNIEVTASKLNGTWYLSEPPSFGASSNLKDLGGYHEINVMMKETPEEFAEKIFTLIQKKDYIGISNLTPTKKEISIIASNSFVNNPNELITKLEKNLSKLKPDIESLQENTKNIDFSACKVVGIEYKLKKEANFIDMERIQVYFSDEKNEYNVSLEHFIHVNGNWKLGQEVEFEKSNAAEDSDAKSKEGVVSVIENKIVFETIDDQIEETIEVFVNINGSPYSIGSVSGMGMGNLSKEEYGDYNIPSDAIDAIEGFWSGLQTIYYLKDLDEEISIQIAERYEGDSSPLIFEEVTKIRKD